MNELIKTYFSPPSPVSPGFEGPEKRLEIDFKPNPDKPLGLRAITKEQWQEMLDFAKCTIISSKSNEFFDSFVLSESSLFVYPTKIMLKTCGTTTLLKCIGKLLEYASLCDLSVEFVMFSRKNFLFPQQQVYPHVGWSAEIDYLNKIFDGTAYVLGPLTAEHWYLYIADYHDHATYSNDEVTLEIMMHDLNREVAEKFYRQEGTGDKDKFPGVADILDGSETDEFNFTPCGYSMNGLYKEAYYTIHVTPEPHCSYASFETNVSLPCYSKLISYVLDLFKPGSMTLTLFSEKRSAFPFETIQDLEIPGFAMTHKTFSQLEGNCDVTLCNYEAIVSARHVSKKRKVPPSSFTMDQ